MIFLRLFTHRPAPAHPSQPSGPCIPSPLSALPPLSVCWSRVHWPGPGAARLSEEWWRVSYQVKLPNDIGFSCVSDIINITRPHQSPPEALHTQHLKYFHHGFCGLWDICCFLKERVVTLVAIVWAEPMLYWLLLEAEILQFHWGWECNLVLISFNFIVHHNMFVRLRYIFKRRGETLFSFWYESNYQCTVINPWFQFPKNVLHIYDGKS